MKILIAIPISDENDMQVLSCAVRLRKLYPGAFVLLIEDGAPRLGLRSACRDYQMNYMEGEDLRGSITWWHRLFSYCIHFQIDLLLKLSPLTYLCSAPVAYPTSSIFGKLTFDSVTGAKYLLPLFQGFRKEFISKAFSSGETRNPCYLFPEFWSTCADLKSKDLCTELILMRLILQVGSSFEEMRCLDADIMVLHPKEVALHPLPPLVANAYSGINKPKGFYPLRRMIHQLEKAIILSQQVPDRRKFGGALVDSILNELFTFTPSIKEGEKFAHVFHWAVSVLRQYFQIDADDRLLAKLSLLLKENPHLETNLPRLYLASERTPHHITPAMLESLFQHRRSIRLFSTSPPQPSLLNRCLDLAATAPSSCNRLAYRTELITDHETAMKVLKIPEGARNLAAPCVIVWIACHQAYDFIRDLKTPIIDGSMACMQFLLVADSFGLGTLVVNFPDDEDFRIKLEEHVRIDDDESVICLVAVGEADPNALIAISAKRPNTPMVKFPRRDIL